MFGVIFKLTKEFGMKTKFYSNLKSGDIRTISFRGKLIRQIYVNKAWRTIETIRV